MGCITSTDKNSGARGPMICLKDPMTTYCTSTMPINELEVDLSHFSAPKEILGIGGFGIVRRVVKNTCSDVGVSYALKSISKQTVLSRPSGTRAVLTELKALIMISNFEHICGLKYAFQDDSFLYMVVEYAIGGDMRYNLRKAPLGRFSEDVSKVVIRQVISAVQHCHDCCILHRDIKPENILLYENGRVKVSDFGVAKILPDIEQCRSTSGTHGYMAPEIYADDHMHGTSFDWFCLGITLHEFLCGRRPYEAVRLQRYHANDRVDRLDLDYLPRIPLSADCIAFVRRILHPDPIYRLGANEGEIEINSHPWLKGEKAIVYEEVVTLLRHELPAFNEIFTNKNSKRTVNRMNVSREEAVSLVKQHQEPAPIPPEEQTAFEDFEYNTRIMSPIFHRVQSSSGSISANPGPVPSRTYSRSRSRSGSGASEGKSINLGILSSGGIRDSLEDDYMDGDDEVTPDDDSTRGCGVKHLRCGQQGKSCKGSPWDDEEMKDSLVDNSFYQQPQRVSAVDNPVSTIPYIPPTPPKPRPRPQSDKFVKYGMYKETGRASIAKSFIDCSDSDTQLSRYKPQRRLSFPSPNSHQDEYIYNSPQFGSNHNPRAISWRKTPAMQNTGKL